VHRLLPLLVVVAIAPLSACTRSSGASEFGVARPASGPLPAVSGRTVQGGRFGPADYRGHVTVVNVWATWCSPCRAEQAALQRVWSDVKGEGVVMVGIDYNDDAAAARDWVKTYDVGYPSVSDPDGSFAADLGFPGLPATYVADASGQLRYRFYGAVTEASLGGVLERLAQPR
jgi:cytochrome c biogenesis protein CcmG/thiol:disulfide interchange protein DsbE